MDSSIDHFFCGEVWANLSDEDFNTYITPNTEYAAGTLAQPGYSALGFLPHLQNEPPPLSDAVFDPLLSSALPGPSNASDMTALPGNMPYYFGQPQGLWQQQSVHAPTESSANYGFGRQETFTSRKETPNTTHGALSAPRESRFVRQSRSTATAVRGVESYTSSSIIGPHFSLNSNSAFAAPHDTQISTTGLAIPNTQLSFVLPPTTTLTAGNQTSEETKKTPNERKIHHDADLDPGHAILSAEELLDGRVLPNDICGGLLLHIAKTMSNSDIAVALNNLYIKLGKRPLTRQLITKRICSALKARNPSEIAYVAARNKLNGERVSNGIAINIPGGGHYDLAKVAAVSERRQATVERNRKQAEGLIGQGDAADAVTETFAPAPTTPKTPAKRTAMAAEINNHDDILPPRKVRRTTFQAKRVEGGRSSNFPPAGDSRGVMDPNNGAT